MNRSYNIPFPSSKEKYGSVSLDSQATSSPWEVVAQRKASKSIKPYLDQMLIKVDNIKI